MRVPFRSAVVALCFLWPLSAADPRWIRIPATDFEVYSSAGERNTRETLQYFERVRSFFEQTMGASPAKLDPIRIIVFGSKKEFDPYRPNESTAAYYTQVGGRDYIVLGSTGAEIFRIVTHEYFHLIAQHAGLNLPPWLNEGLAEVYSTLNPLGDKVTVGTVIPGHLKGLAFEKPIPLATLLAVNQDSPYYNEKNIAGTFYDESWALAHMLQLSPAYSPKFIKVIEAIGAGTPSPQTLETVYGKTLTEIEDDLRSYVAGNSFRGAQFPIRIANQTEHAAAEPASPFDVKLALLDLTNRLGREEETRKKLEELASNDPKRPEPYVGLGYLAVRASQMEDARSYFAKSLELGSRNPTMLWDYGQIAAQTAPDDSIRALGLLLIDQPSRADVRLVLAQVQVNSKQWSAALDTFRPIRAISVADAPTYFRQTAFADLNLGNSEGARAAGQQWARHAKDSADRENAEQFEKYLDSLGGAASKPAPSGASIATSTPELARTVSGSALPVPGPDANPAPPRAPVEPDKPTFRSDANFISVDAQVLAKGKSVVGLKQEDFEIWDNDRLQTISSFGSEDQSIDLILLLDYSGSTHSIETRVKSTAAEAMSHLHSADRVGVVVFDTATRLVAPLSSYFQRVDAAIRAIPWNGRNTELNATLLKAVLYLRQEGRPGAHRHIIALTDNKGDLAVSNETVRDALWESDAVLSLIRFDTRDPGYSHDPIHADLRQFVTATGGDMLDDSRKGTGLVEMFQRLHERYVILYRAPQDKTGSVHKIRVNLTEKAKSALGDVQVHARTGYREGQANSEGRSQLGKPVIEQKSCCRAVWMLNLGFLRRDIART